MLLSIISEIDEIKATEFSIRSLLSDWIDVYQKMPLPHKMSNPKSMSSFPARVSERR
jgi:hypothetical protein